MNQKQNQNQQQFGMRESCNLMYALAKIHAMCFWPIIRRDFGTDALGRPAGFALVLMLLVGGLGRIPEMFPYVGLWLFMLLYQRSRTAKLVKQGTIWHSFYEGYPAIALGCKLVRCSEAKAKQFIEPMLCLAVGVALTDFSQGLGMFVMAGCVSMAIVDGINREIDRKRLAAMRDAEIEQRWLVARYRGQVDE
jgi:hypothetical protein